MLFLRGDSRLTTELVERSGSTLSRLRSMGNPRRTGLYGTTRSSVVGTGISGLVATHAVGGTQRVTDIGGQALEQGTRIARLGFMLFLCTE